MSVLWRLSLPSDIDSISPYRRIPVAFLKLTGRLEIKDDKWRGSNFQSNLQTTLDHGVSLVVSLEVFIKISFREKLIEKLRVKPIEK